MSSSKISSINRRLRKTATLTVGAAAGGVALLAGQAALADRSIGRLGLVAPFTDGRYGNTGQTGVEPLKFAMLGDSGAGGLGAEHPTGTSAAYLARMIAETLLRPVDLTNFAQVGATSADLAPQVSEALAAQPDLIVMTIGTNDVVRAIDPATAGVLVGREVERIRAAGIPVVVGVCPDAGAVKRVMQPLRALLSKRSKAIAREQYLHVMEAGGLPVLMGEVVSPQFKADQSLYAADGFHPNSRGYEVTANGLFPAVMEALA